MSPRAALSNPLPGSEYINFTIDAQLLRELGERLVGKPQVALGELVKNAYDADASRCVIRFVDDLIEIADDGNGMSHDEFVNKWMRIGSSHKRQERESPRFRRTLTGSKGIGRLSAQFLGSSIEVISEATAPAAKPIVAHVDWDDAYKRGALIEAGAWVKDDAPSGQLPHGFQHGTCIRIRGLKDVWTPQRFKELAGEFWFLQPPALVAEDMHASARFRIEVQGVDEASLEIFEKQTAAAVESWIARLEGSIRDGRRSGVANLKVTFAGAESYEATYELPNRALDSAQFQVLIFNLAGRQRANISVAEAREYFKRFGGVHIYDSGFRLPYYGGGDQDWLQIEVAHSHRLIRSQLVPEELQPPDGTLQDLPTLSRVLGIVQVSTPHESRAASRSTAPSKVLSVQVTRDRLNDNEAFDDLVHFVRWAFDFYSLHSSSRRQKTAVQTLEREEDDVDIQLNTVRQRVFELEGRAEAKYLRPLQTALDQFEEAEKRRRRIVDAERVLLGALATAGMASVALQHDLSKELSALKDVLEDFESRARGASDQEIGTLLDKFRRWLAAASQTRRLFSPLFAAEDREKMQRMRAKRVLDRLASNLAPLMRGVEVETDDVPPDLRLPKGTLAGWNAVFQNLFLNSVNAMLDTQTKRIRCRASVDGRGRMHLIIEDSGVGVDLEQSDDLFKPFVRKLELPPELLALGLGGMGIGLTIVRMVCRTFGCHVRFVKPRSPFKTAIDITWEDAPNG